MRKSDSIKNVMTALGQFQAEAVKIRKDSINPHFKSKYASLSVILDEIQPFLTKCGLVFTQIPEGGKHLTTILFHPESGESFEVDYDLNSSVNTPQGIGSAITYARRYSLTAILGLNIDDDDDGNASSTQPKAPQPQPAPQPKQQQQAPAAQQQPQPAPMPTAFNRSYPNPDAIMAVIELCKEGKDVTALYMSNKAIVDANNMLQQALKKRELQIKNGGKIIPTDTQIGQVCDRIRKGDTKAFEGASGAFILNAGQLERLQQAVTEFASIEERISIRYTILDDIATIIEMCNMEAQVMKVYQHNAMIIDRTPDLQTRMNARLRALKPAA